MRVMFHSFFSLRRPADNFLVDDIAKACSCIYCRNKLLMLSEARSSSSIQREHATVTNLTDVAVALLLESINKIHNKIEE